MSKQSLLLVDGDTRSLRVLEVSLRKAGFTVTTAVSVQDALDKLELDAPDLIISETTFPNGDGFELRRRVRATPDWGEIPFIFLTAENAIENKIRGLELGVDDYLTKPIYIKEIVTRINILLQKRQRTRFEEKRDGRTRFAGRVQDMPVVDVIQTIEISRKSGVIQFVGDRGRQAAIYFRDGKVIDAEAGALSGEDAAYRLLTWNEGEFEVVFRTVRRREKINISSQGLLMEGMRRLDEWSRLLEQLPPLAHRFEIDIGELAARLGDVPDDHNRLLRLIDGKRTLLEVIEASDMGDLECVQVISKMYFEDLLVDLDHASPAPVQRTTGRPMPAVALDAGASRPAPAPVPIPADPLSGIDDDVKEPAKAAEIGPGAAAALAAAAEAMARASSKEESAAAESAGVEISMDEAAAAEVAAESAASKAGSAGAASKSGAAAGAASKSEAAEGAASKSGAGESAASKSGAGEGTASKIAAAEAAAAAIEEEEEEEDEDDEPGAGESLPGALMGGYRPSSLRLIDEAVAAAQAIEPLMFEDLVDAIEPHVNGAAGGSGAAASGVVAKPASGESARVAVATKPVGEGGAGAGPSRAAPAEVARSVEMEAGEPPVVSRPARSGSKTAPISLGAAAPRVAEPRATGQGSGEIGRRPRSATMPGIPPGPAVAAAIAEAQPALPRAITDSLGESDPALPRTTTDSGLRMIGSLGRDRAEASGELLPSGGTPPPVSETQRELVTILPRRVTREIQAVSIPEPVVARAPTPAAGAVNDAAASAAAGAATQPASADATSSGAGAAGAAGAAATAAGAPAAASGAAAGAAGAPVAGASGAAAARGPAATPIPTAPATSAPVEPPREPSGPFDQTATRIIRPQTGLGMGPVVLIVATAALAAAAVYLRLRRTPAVTEPVAVARDAGLGDASVTAALTPDAPAISPVDAGAPVISPMDAGVPIDAAPVDAAPPRDGRSPEEEKSAQAKSLLDRANEGIAEGAFNRALRAVDQSLALRKTWRAYLTRAKALQRLDRVDEALAAIDAAERLAPRNASVFEMRGRILWAVRRKDEARRQFERFLQLEPTGARAQQIQKLIAEP